MSVTMLILIIVSCFSVGFLALQKAYYEANSYGMKRQPKRILIMINGTWSEVRTIEGEQ